MEIIKIDLDNPDQKVIKNAADILRRGGVVVYPTDTAYGLGVNALEEKAIKKVYEIKGRNFSKPTHAIVRDWKMIKELCFANDTVKKLYEYFLPGPLTIILLKKKVVPDILTAGLTTLGIRIPNNQVTNLLSNQLTIPYTTPSANREGGKTPYSIDEVKKELDIQKIDLVLDAGQLPSTPPSTIVDLTTTPIKIIREGPISKEKISSAVM